MTARRLFPVFALASGLLIATVLGEGILRVWVWLGVPRSHGFIRFMKAAEGAPSRGPLFRPSDDPELGIECVPNSQRGAIRINSWGFRGGEVAERPAEGVVRVAVVGDSETFGAALAEEHTLPGALAAALNGQQAARYEVLNLGVPGYNTLQELRVVETKVPRLHPHVVVLYYVLNDAELTPRTVLLRGGGLRSSHLGLLVSYLSKAGWPADAQSLRSQLSIVDYYHSLHEGDRFEATSRLILRMAELLRKERRRFIVAIAPEVYAIPGFRRYPYRDIHERLARLASPGLEVVDPLDRLAADRQRPRRYWVSADDPHKNEEANRIIAGVLAEALRRAPVPAERPAGR